MKFHIQYLKSIQEVEKHGAAYVPVEGARAPDPVVEQGAVPEQGAPGGPLGQDQKEGVGDHHRVVGGEDPPGPAEHEGGVVLLPAGGGRFFLKFPLPGGL